MAFELRDLLRRFRAARNGNVAVTFALVLLPLVAIAGGAMDVARVLAVRDEAQNALDEAVLAGAKDGSSNWTAAARATFTANIKPALIDKATPVFSKSDSSHYVGKLTGAVDTYFSKLIGFAAYSVTITSTAVRKDSTSTPCILLLDTTASQSLLVNSGANVTATSCEIHVKSTASPAAIFNSGSTINTKKICIAGNKIIDNGGTHYNTSTGCTTADDPYAGKWPTPSSSSCTYSNANYNGGSVTMNPGTYCGWFNFNGSPTVTFNPGTYVIVNGGWNVNGGTWTGKGVTFFFADSSRIQFNSGVKATLSAATTGTYAGLLFGEPAGLSKSQFVFDDSKGHDLEGIIYLPSRNMTFNAGSQVTSDELTLIANTLILNQTTWAIEPYSAISSSSSSSDSVIYLEK